MKRVLVFVTALLFGVMGMAAPAAAAPDDRVQYIVQMPEGGVSAVWNFDAQMEEMNGYLKRSRFVYGSCTFYVDPHCVHVVMYEAGKNNNGQHQWTRKGKITSHWIRLNSEAERDRPKSIVTTVKHELGHLAGLPHNPKCISVMYYQSGCGKGKPRPATFTSSELKTLARF